MNKGVSARWIWIPPPPLFSEVGDDPIQLAQPF